MSDHRTRSPRTSKLERSRARSIGRRCRGRTLLAGQVCRALIERLERESVEFSILPIDDTSPVQSLAVNEPCDTIVLVGALEYRDPDRAAALVRDAFATLAPNGRLLVCVPNADHVTVPGRRQTFDRASLKKLLKKVDQPKIFTDQPYRWLLMGLERDAALDHSSRERCRVIAELCRGDVLELGCGPGHLCGEIAGRGLTVTGVDMNAPKIEKARRRYPGAAFRQANILELECDRTHDTVVLAEVLEHVDENVGARMLSKAWSLVAPGGRLVVSVPNQDCVPHRNHLREFTLENFIRSVAGLGKPRVVTEQPFKWLLLHVDRSTGRRETSEGQA